MSVYWIRELSSTGGTASGTPFSVKVYALFLRYVCGYHTPTQSVGGGTDYWSYEKTGTNGELNLTGADKNFRDSVIHSFVVGDINKWILITGVNAGLYKITAYIDTATITIDFRSGVAEWPLVQTGASWYLLAENYQLPASGSWWRLCTPHADGWALEATYDFLGGSDRVSLRVALDSNWSGVKILGPVYFGSFISTNWVYVTADSTGEWIYFMMHNSVASKYCGAFVCKTTPITGSSSIISLHGSISSPGNDQTFYRGQALNEFTPNKVGHGYVYSETYGLQLATYISEITDTTFNNGLTQWAGRQQNARITKWDLSEGSVTFVINSVDLTVNGYGVLGILKGHYSASIAIAARTAINDSGTNDKFHFCDGFVFDWPNVTPQH